MPDSVERIVDILHQQQCDDNEEEETHATELRCPRDEVLDMALYGLSCRGYEVAKNEILQRLRHLVCERKSRQNGKDHREHRNERKECAVSQ